jgi:ferritin-like metal-binding protein YciE
MHISQVNLSEQNTAATARHASPESDSPRVKQSLSLDQTLEQCLLETQRQVYRLEEIVHRLGTVAARTTIAPVGVMSLIQEGNRRLKHEVDEFTLDSHAVASMVRLPPVKLTLHTALRAG